METPLTHRRRQHGEPLDRRAYERAGGYGALRSALGRREPADLIGMVERAKLRGRGGAGFPTAKKWSSMPTGEDAPSPRYLVANSDEMEPGTFKDRHLMEEDPHQFIEGIVLSAYAMQADTAFIFLRWAYKLAERRLRRAIAEAYDAGYLGRDILGSGYDLELHVHVSAGRYMCGEETGLLNALEGKRATPRSKPPYTGTEGAWGMPTVVQNVETLCNVPHIVERGPEWYRGLSRCGDGGTKLYGASGKVRRPGMWELPLGTALREILEEHAGGLREGLRLKGVLPGGASTGFLVEDHLDVAMDYDSVSEAGSRLGTGTMIVLDDRTCPVGMVLNMERFFAQESCGWCTPCREGLPWTVRLVEDVEEGRGSERHLERLGLHGRLLGPGHTFCALAPGAAAPLRSALRHFGADFERHVHERRCPWRAA